jgi:hypothetical protein
MSEGLKIRNVAKSHIILQALKKSLHPDSKTVHPESGLKDNKRIKG